MVGYVEVLPDGVVRIDQTAIDECLPEEVGPETHEALVFPPVQDRPDVKQILFAEIGVIEDEDMCDLEEGQDGYYVSSDLAADTGLYECWATNNDGGRPSLSVDLSLPVED